MQFHRFLNKYTLLISLSLLTLLLLFFTGLHTTQVTIHKLNGNGQQQIQLPLYEHSHMGDQSVTEYIVRGMFLSSPFSQHIVTIIPDDCIHVLRVNDINVDLNEKIHGTVCDYVKGFTIDLGKYLKNGTNTFQIQLLDYGGWYGLSLNSSLYDKEFLTLIVLFLIEVFVLLYFFLHDTLRFPKIIVVFFLLGIGIRILYLSYTPYGEKTHDVLAYGGHLDYIRYVATHLQLPKPDTGWEFYQSPLYYVIAGVMYKFTQLLSINSFIFLQILSLCFSGIFLLFGIKILQIFCKKNILLITASALLIFWPSGIIHAIRIGNDPLYYLLSVMSIFFLLEWIRKKKNLYFYSVSFLTACTIATKLNGIILLPLLCGIFLVTCFNPPSCDSRLKKTIFLLIILGFGLFISLFRNLQTAQQNKQFNPITSARQLNTQLAVGNSIQNYVVFDMHTYVTKAFTNAWTDDGGRQYFWNFFLKSMLFGEFSFPYKHAYLLATLMSFFLLPFFVYFCIGLLSGLRRLSLLQGVLPVWFVLSLASLLYYRFTYPFSPDGDFRFILPVLIPFVYFVVSGMSVLAGKYTKIFRWSGYVLSYCFILISCLFFLIPLT